MSDNNSGLIDLRKNSSSHSSNKRDDRGPRITSEEKSEELGEKLGEIDRLSREAETRARAQGAGLGYVNLSGVAIDPDALRVISEDEARSLRTVCFTLSPYKEVRLAVENIVSPGLDELATRLEEKHHAPVRRFLVTPDSLEWVLRQYAALPKVKPVEHGIDVTPEELDKFKGISSFEALRQALKDVSTTERLALIVAAAMQLDASDAHVEAETSGLVLRFRIDGVLHEVTRFDKTVERPLFSRVKLVSGLKINVTDRPQDGHFVIRRPEGKVDVRVSAVPTNYGESLVMRILRSDIAQHDLKDLGLSSRDLEALGREIHRPNGLLVVCGPTGSGKTTTLYAALARINTPENKILTIEDPIEYELPGINQSQVDREKGYGFTEGLKALVRQDPDVILVGEMRDNETVEIAINSALTGHLVFSTMHTNDAAGALPRFMAMAAKPYLLAPALNSVLAQRLVRELCGNCKRQEELKPELQARVDKLMADLPDSVKSEVPTSFKFFEASGCEVCSGLGYKDRIGIFEIFSMTPELKDLIMKGEPSEMVVREQLKKQQMVTIAQDGILKALQGITSVAEVFRVVEER